MNTKVDRQGTTLRQRLIVAGACVASIPFTIAAAEGVVAILSTIGIIPGAQVQP